MYTLSSQCIAIIIQLHIVAHFIQCLIYKSNFIIDMYMLRKADILDSVVPTVSGIHRVGVLECVTILAQLTPCPFYI